MKYMLRLFISLSVFLWTIPSHADGVVPVVRTVGAQVTRGAGEAGRSAARQSAQSARNIARNAARANGVTTVKNGGAAGLQPLSVNTPLSILRSRASVSIPVVDEKLISPEIQHLISLPSELKWPEELYLNQGRFYLTGARPTPYLPITDPNLKGAESVRFLDNMIGRYVLNPRRLLDEELKPLLGEKNTALYSYIDRVRQELAQHVATDPGSMASQLDDAVSNLIARNDFLDLVTIMANDTNVSAKFAESIGSLEGLAGRFAERVFNSPLLKNIRTNPSVLGSKLLQARHDFVHQPVLYNIHDGQFLKLVEQSGQVLWEIEVGEQELKRIIPKNPFQEDLRPEVLNELIFRELSGAKALNREGIDVQGIQFIYEVKPSQVRGVAATPEEKMAARTAVNETADRITKFIQHAHFETKYEIVKEAYVVRVTVPLEQVKSFLLGLQSAYLAGGSKLFNGFNICYHRRGETADRVITSSGMFSKPIKELLDPLNTKAQEYVAVLNRETVEANIEELQRALDVQMPLFVKYAMRQLPIGKEFMITPSYRFGYHEISRIPHVHIELLLSDPAGKELPLLFNFNMPILISKKAKDALMQAIPDESVGNILNKLPKMQSVPMRTRQTAS